MAIIGSGAGVTAELLAKAGLQVVVIEEGPLKSSTDFKQKESDAYLQLYQESAARKTEDKAINILQGRCVGGSTTVNWTNSFRTPASTLKFWQENLASATTASMHWHRILTRPSADSTSRPGWLRRMKTTTCCVVALPNPGLPPQPFHATSKAAGIWAHAASAARPMPSSRCWSPPFSLRSTWVRSC